MAVDWWAAETRSHYRDDRNLVRRQSLFDFVSSSSGSLIDAVAPFVSSGLVLDVGCGNGIWPAQFKREGSGAVFVGVDTSVGMAQVAKRQPAVAAVAQADICALPFADRSFDTVMALWMLYHVRDKDTALRDLNRVKKPNGCVIAVTNSDAQTPLNKIISAALTETLGRCVDTFVPQLDFTSENGREILLREFERCETYQWEVRFEIPTPEPIVELVESMHQPIESTLGPVDWTKANDQLRSHAQHEIRRTGHVPHVLRQAAFVAR